MSDTSGPHSNAAGHALVVGATSDIGAAVVRRLVEGGRHVTAWGRSPDRLRGLKSAHGEMVTVRTVDVTDPRAVTAAMTEFDVSTAEARADTAGRPLDVVVWAVGIFDWGPADRAEPERWARLLEVNLVAAARATPQILLRLTRTPGSSLVFIGSGAAHRVFADNAAYVASKHGLAALAAASFLDVKRHGVRVSIVSPGLVAAGAGLLSPQAIEDSAALLQPEDVAGAVDYVVNFPARGCPVLVELQPLI
jgi:NADP-dependent 3-hydroxy acid dehydrogenase YdfG